VAAPGVTVVDDGTIAERRGSLNVDDEGERPGRTVLIEDGILRGYLQDPAQQRPDEDGSDRQRPARGILLHPAPRMTNTFMLAGQDDPDEIVRSVSRGLYAKHFGGGQVDITSGKFVFSATEAYLIEDGKIGAPVFGATLIGNGPDVLTKVTRIGHDLRLDEGVGTCQKAGQSVPVGVGLPTILVSGITVGGTTRTGEKPRGDRERSLSPLRVVLHCPPAPRRTCEPADRARSRPRGLNPLPAAGAEQQHLPPQAQARARASSSAGIVRSAPHVDEKPGGSPKSCAM